MKRNQVVVVRLLEQIKNHLDNPLEANRLLRELGKFYDPVTGAAVMEGAERKRLVDLLERGEREEVCAAIDRHIEDYLAQLPEGGRANRADPLARDPPGGPPDA
jgi:DNA-binding GntR family transcriptional regulator